MVIFGITQPQRKRDDIDDEEEQRGKAAGVQPLATEIGVRGASQTNAAAYPKSGNRQLNSQGSFGSGSSGSQPVGARLSNGSTDSKGAKPMIVVASNDANRGASLPYDVLAAACNDWADNRRIGSGGAATVYRAELPRYGTVAVKRFHPKDGSSREWTRELEALIQCRHPHILEIIGHADEGPENLIVMPLMEGGTLCESLHKMMWSSRVVDMGQVVRALSFLHGKGILHRDVKSSNILLDASLRYTRLADFGLAKDQVSRAGKQTSHGTTGVVMGSPGYMAPELMMRPANEKTDAYAAGVVFLEILTGLPAWDMDENGAVLTDRAVIDGSFVDNCIDPKASWPLDESAACAKQATALTLFDPSSRKTLAALEQDPAYVLQLERAVRFDSERFGHPSFGAVPSSGSSAGR